MVQAKRQQKKKKIIKRDSFQCLWLAIAGIVIGVLATTLWHGIQSNQQGIGSGIREMIEHSKQTHSPEQIKVKTKITEQKSAPQKKINYDFFTVLPEIEIVISDQDSGAQQHAAVKTKKGNTTVKKTKIPATSFYMLQAGAYRHPTDADRMKASLALNGVSSIIQKVSIQGQGDFYRVRIGPFNSYVEMTNTEKRLTQVGVKSLRLKIPRAID